MKRAICFVMTLVLLTAFCACQPTPENEAVVNKRDGVYEQKIEIAKKEEQKNPVATVAPAPTEVPAYAFEPHWTDKVSLKNFDIDIDVDIEAPATANFPVYRVKSTPFAVEDSRLEAICRVLIGEAAFVRPGGATIQDLKEQLEQLQLGQYDPETQTWHPYDKETYDELAGDIMKEMETAPDEGDFSSSITQIESLPAQLTYRAEDGTLWELYYQEDALTLSRNVRCIEQPERWIVEGVAIDGVAKGTTLDNLSCTEEEARQSIQAFFEAVDIGDMDISRLEKGWAVDMDTLEVVKEGWLAECARKGGSCTAVNYKWESTGGLRFADEPYSAGLKAESILLFVDDQGVATITWSNPLEILQVEVDNIEILPFEQVQTLIEQAIFNGLSWRERKDSDKNWGSEYHVTRIALSYCFAPIKDTPEEFYFTPTWFVCLRDNDAPESVRDLVIGINAVDGTRIDVKGEG